MSVLDTINRISEELAGDPTQEELGSVFLYYGLACYRANILETQLRSIVALETEDAEIINGRGTLGYLVKRAKQLSVFEARALETLSALVTKRNRLMHSITLGIAAATPVSRAKFIDQCCQIAEEFRATAKMLSKDLGQALERLDASPEEVEAIFREALTDPEALTDAR